jgi:hypothetical protein
MVFTDRFIKVPIKVYNTRVKELTGDEGELTDSWEKINPFEIQSYRPDIDNENELIVTVKNRDPFTVYLSVEEFEKLLNNHLGV